MKHESDDRNLVIVDDTTAHGLAKWAPMVVVLSVLAGFVVLSWYAYHVGVQSVKDEDLLVVEAEKTPMKEKPLDPGGMKFPNQDKTIFDTFAGNSQQPSKVERVLPKPEEPLAKGGDADTGTWINEKLQNHSQDSATIKEKVISPEEKKTGSLQPVAPVVDKARTTAASKVQNIGDHQIIAADVADDTLSETYVANKTIKKELSEPVSAPVAAVEAAVQKAVPASSIKTEEKHKTEEKVRTEDKLQDGKKAKPRVLPAGNAVVQLGAYRSEDELYEAWNKMQVKFDDLSYREPTVIRADLGAKGIYYRLRIAGIANAAEAKTLCATLSAKGQACILISDK